MNKRSRTKFGILGMSYDTSASKGYPGARYAPEQIRQSLQWILKRIENDMLYDVDEDKLVDMGKIEIKDYGDTNMISRFEHERSLNEIKYKIDEIFQEGYIPILLGGDHSTGWSGIKSLYDNTTGKIGVIHLDAHLDLVKTSPVQGDYSGSSQMRRASEMDRIDCKNIVQLGMRGYNSAEHYNFIKNSGITIITANTVLDKGVEPAIERCLEVACNGTDHVYLSVDIDVLDSAFAPGSGANEPGGLTSHQLFTMVKRFAPVVDAIDIVEVNPMTDFNNVTSNVACKLLFDFIISNYHATRC